MEALKTVETMGSMKGAWVLTLPLFALILIGAWTAKKMVMDENEKKVVGFLIFVLAVILCLIIFILHMEYIPQGLRSNGSLLCWLGGVTSLACIVIIAGLHFKWPGFTPPAAAVTPLKLLLSTPLIASVPMVVIGITTLLRH